MTGSTQTVMMDPRYKHYDPTGKVVTQISIPDGVGTYVITSPADVLQAPEISPRLSTMGTDPVMVTITSENPNATIRYTLGGARLGLDSPIYTGPFQVSANVMVQAGAYLKGDCPSWANSAMFNVTSATPTAEFVSSSHAGPAGAYFPVLSLSAIPTDTVTVQYTVRAPTGATTTGTVSFLPGNPYRYFPITVSGAVGTVTTVTINNVTGGGAGHYAHAELHRPVRVGAAFAGGNFRIDAASGDFAFLSRTRDRHPKRSGKRLARRPRF